MCSYFIHTILVSLNQFRGADKHCTQFFIITGQIPFGVWPLLVLGKNQKSVDKASEINYDINIIIITIIKRKEVLAFVKS